MKNTILFSICFIIGLIPISGLSQTDICGNALGVWDLNGSPYNLTCDVTVQPGATLIIEPGVIVQGNAGVDLIVFGRILAIGEENNPITFTASDPMNGEWGGIELHDEANDDSEISNAVIEYALAGIWLNDIFPTLQNLTIQHNTAGMYNAGYTCCGEEGFVYNSDFIGNDVGVYIESIFKYRFKNCNFFENTNAGVYFKFAGGNEIDTRITKFERCLIYNNDFGFVAEGSRPITITNCTITNNNSSELILENTRSNTKIENSIFWGGEFEDGIVVIGNVDSTTVSYSNVSQFTGTYTGTENINQPPLFQDVDSHDYNLQCLSPCINAGNPDSPLDPDGTAADMGALWFDFSMQNSTASNNSPVCEGEEVILTANSSCGVSYEWSGINGFSSSSQNPVLPSVTPDMAGEYSVLITTSDSLTIELSTEVIINSLPTAGINGDLLFCEGESTTLTASGGTSYEWSNGATSSNITVNTAGDYSVTVTDGNGCTDTDLVTVVINPLPTAMIAGNLEICEGESTTLTASGGTSYEWSNGATSSNITVNTAGDYSVTVTDGNGCTDTDLVTVVINPLPTAMIAGNLEICEGESTTITASGGTTYEWNTGETSSSITITSPGNYSVTVTDDNSCENSTSTAVVELPLPNVSFVLNLNDSICVNDPAVELMGGTPFGGSYSGPGITNGFFDPHTAGIGSHSITYTYQDPSTGCSNSATQNIIVIGGDCLTALSSITDEYSVIVFPNPSDGIFTVQFENWKDLKSIHLFDSQGRIIYTNETMAGLIQINGIPRGSYFLKVISDEKVAVKEILVH